jgi:hypothetical protein
MAVPIASPSFVIDDVHVERIPDSIAVHWDLVFDVDWVGEAAPGPLRCKWRIINREGEVVQVGVVNVSGDADDQVAGTVYPDEVPGVPETGEVRC